MFQLAQDLVGYHGTRVPVERSAAKGPRPQFARACEITVLDVADGIASAKVVSEPFVDDLRLTKLDGRCSIVNVLYEVRELASEWAWAVSGRP